MHSVGALMSQVTPALLMGSPAIPWGWPPSLLSIPGHSQPFQPVPMGFISPDLRLLCFKGRNTPGLYCLRLMCSCQEASLGTGGAGL